MATKTTSSSSEISSITTSTEIVPIQSTNDSSSSFNNSTGITTTQNLSLNDNTTKQASLGHSKAKCEKPTDNNDITSTTENDEDNNNSDDKTRRLFETINGDLIYTRNLVSGMLKQYEDKFTVQIEDASKMLENLRSAGTQDELRELKTIVEKLKLQISSKYIISSANPHGYRDLGSDRSTKIKQVHAKDSPHGVPNLYKNADFERSSTFEVFQVLYHGLSVELKLCLLCFSVFPENAVIKRRLMMYWWIGEGFVPPIPRDEKTKREIADGKTAEDFANEFFEELMEKGFIEPLVETNLRLVMDSCKMRPLVRLAVIMLAERTHFFDFDPEGNPTAAFSRSYRACLMGAGLTNHQDLDKLHMLFNFNNPDLDFKPELFLKMKNVNLLFLGRWQNLAPHCIEVQETKFLEGLNNMHHLRVFSLQEIFGIEKLPDSISKLVNLMVLDLRACHNLRVVPGRIGSLKSLTHLDMSECYLLDHMPKELSLLCELQVLKGFVIGGSKDKKPCTLEDLARLPKLRKLSIYTELKSFPTETELNAFPQFKMLCKLTIEWGERSFLPTETEPTAAAATKPHVRGALTSSLAMEFPSRLEKLDLRCFPGMVEHGWLKPRNLKSLKRLYLRGGKFCNLGQFQQFDDKWSVEVLRLRYLSELEMEWRELRALFPELIYLETVNCPKLTFFPCNQRGVWTKR